MQFINESKLILCWCIYGPSDLVPSSQILFFASTEFFSGDSWPEKVWVMDKIGLKGSILALRRRGSGRGRALWSRITTNWDVSTRPLACPFALLLYSAYRSLIHLVCTACFAPALRCAHLISHSLMGKWEIGCLSIRLFRTIAQRLWKQAMEEALSCRFAHTNSNPVRLWNMLIVCFSAWRLRIAATGNPLCIFCRDLGGMKTSHCCCW